MIITVEPRANETKGEKSSVELKLQRNNHQNGTPNKKKKHNEISL